MEPRQLPRSPQMAALSVDAAVDGAAAQAISGEGAAPTPTTDYPRIRDTLLHHSAHPFDFAKIETELMGDRWVGAELAEDPGPDVPTPPRWLASEPDDASLARVRWRYKLRTYERFDLNDIINRPHPMFEVLQNSMRPLVLGMTYSFDSDVLHFAFLVESAAVENGHGSKAVQHGERQQFAGGLG